MWSHCLPSCFTCEIIQRYKYHWHTDAMWSYMAAQSLHVTIRKPIWRVCFTSNRHFSMTLPIDVNRPVVTYSIVLTRLWVCSLMATIAPPWSRMLWVWLPSNWRVQLIPPSRDRNRDDLWGVKKLPITPVAPGQTTNSHFPVLHGRINTMSCDSEMSPAEMTVSNYLGDENN